LWAMRGFGQHTLLGVISGGVVHGRGFESWHFGGNGSVVHGRGFECLTFWG
jgi:hypothetical protein